MLNYSGKEKKIDFEGKPGEILDELVALSKSVLETLSNETKIPYDELQKVYLKGLKNARKKVN